MAREPQKGRERDDTRSRGDNRDRDGREREGGRDREGRGDRGDSRDSRGGDRGDEFTEKLIGINRTSKVVKGGSRFSFSAMVVVGDQNGRVGMGLGKAKEVPESIRKAVDQAKKNMIRIPLKEGRTLHHEITARYGAGYVVMRPAAQGTGIIAGGAVRPIFEALGVKDVLTKSLGSSNPHNMTKAAFKALTTIRSPRYVATKRGMAVDQVRIQEKQ